MHHEDEAARVIMISAILHNLCIDNGDTGEEILHLDVHLGDESEENLEYDDAGIRTINALIKYIQEIN